MALPSSGPLSFSQIGAALCSPQSAPYSLRSMSAAAGFSAPDSVSEFYGYSCPYAFVDIANDTAGTNITNVTVGGVQVTGVTFPVLPGTGASGQTDQLGASVSIGVSYTNVSNDSVEVIDTASNLTCISATSTSRIFAGQVVNSGGTITIAMFDGSC